AIVDAGWGIRREGVRLRDKYHDRVLLPFRDDHGHIVGVTGRSTTWKPGDPFPKYLNHPQTLTFDKGAVLYRPTVRQLTEHGTVIMCEGTLDALAIACA